MDQPTYVMSLYFRLLGFYFPLAALVAGIYASATGALWPGIAFAVLGLAYGYWTLFRVAHRLVIDGDSLRWFAPLNRGEAPLGKLVSIEPTVMRSVMIFSFRGRRSVQTISGRGFVAFAHAVELAAPGTRIRFNLADRIRNALPPSEPFPGTLSAWDPDDDA